MSNSLDDFYKEVTHLYVDKEMTVRQIATHFGCAYSKIYNALRSRVVMRGRSVLRQTGNHLKIAETIRDRIIDGDWKPGHQIPSQLELRWTFNVSSRTVVDAVAHLRERGYLLPKSGRGTFVRPKECWEQDGSDW